jgi:hypothetical protein
MNVQEKLVATLVPRGVTNWTNLMNVQEKLGVILVRSVTNLTAPWASSRMSTPGSAWILTSVKPFQVGKKALERYTKVAFEKLL